MNSQACMICDAIVPSGPTLLVLKGRMTGVGEFVEARPEGVLCPDRVGCTQRAEARDQTPEFLGGVVGGVILSDVDEMIEDEEDADDVDTKRLANLRFQF